MNRELSDFYHRTKEENELLREALLRANEQFYATAVISHGGRSWDEQLVPVLLNTLPPKSPLFELLRHCVEAQAESTKIGPTPATEPLRENRKRERTLRELLDRINSILTSYSFRPFVRHYPRFTVSWHSGEGYEDPATGDCIPDDTSAIPVILDLLEAGRLDRVRQCAAPNCRQWFFAASKKKLVCSDSCRFRKYQTKQESKQKRREYMRSYMNNPRVKARLKKRAAMQQKVAKGGMWNR